MEFLEERAIWMGERNRTVVFTGPKVFVNGVWVGTDRKPPLMFSGVVQDV
ncbi:hypothetical protein B9Z19DRAFT_1158408 [Tuber borchii]|uniref:Uncharacterized protein n=1 Tax=Tuber borchii TaxID=42251 RepID=A0A2T6ZG41_TUBBO|nr:hypothetical protein B9Z19DRAFT_1158408 [Tuber borchii]